MINRPYFPFNNQQVYYSNQPPIPMMPTVGMINPQQVPYNYGQFVHPASTIQSLPPINVIHAPYHNVNPQLRLFHPSQFMPIQPKPTFVQSTVDPNLPWLRAAKDPLLIKKGTEIFVGNLAFTVNEYDLYLHFKECGDIIDVNINLFKHVF